MIERQNVQSGILKSWSVANSLNLGETISSPAPLGMNEEFRDLLLEAKTSYVDLYTRGLQLSHYNFLLNDYSYFQFSYSAPNHVRYAYYPNPFTGEPVNDSISSVAHWREELEEDIITHEQYLDLLRGLGPEMRAPVLRYENAPNQYKPFHHPCSHFHFGFHSNNRWPARRVLTPFAFTLLVLKNYYGEVWRAMGIDDNDPFGNSFENKLVEERVKHCRLIGDELFSSLESQTFSFS
jgi:hypothetical protein